MRKILIFGVTLALMCLTAMASNVAAQEIITGNIIKYGSGRYTGLRTSAFTLKINSITPDDQAQRFLGILQSDGQDALLEAIRKEDVGRFSLSGQIGQTVNAVREVTVGNKRTIYAVFERWTQFAELRGGYRSLDYPFGYIEINIDTRTGKGSGQYFAAAKIRWKNNKEGMGSHVEIEDYATFPAKLVNINVKQND